MLAFVAVLLASQGPAFRTSQIDVTPDELLPLGGYTARGDRKMEAGGERLFARALVFEQRETKIAIVSFEALTVPESLYAEVKKQIPEGSACSLSQRTRTLPRTAKCSTSA